MTDTSQVTADSSPLNSESWPAFFKRVNFKIKLRILGLLFAGVLSTGACIVVITLILIGSRGSHPHEVAAGHERKLSGVANEFAYSYEIQNVAIPLFDRVKKRTAYAQFSLILDCPSEEAKRQMELNRAKLLDSIFEVALQFQISDFSTPSGKDQPSAEPRWPRPFCAWGPCCRPRRPAP